MRLYIAGHTGLVGSACVDYFSGLADVALLTAPRSELDLTDSQAVHRWLASERPDAVILAAGRVGGIAANTRYPAEFIYENVMIEANIIHGAWEAGVARLVNFGSSCMYPKQCPQPMRVELLMTGSVEPTSEPYAVAKWAGVSLCASYSRQHKVRFISAIPATVYGPGDSFDPESAHVLSALIRKLHAARQQRCQEVTLWGSGRARREFLYADDLACACAVLLQRYEAAAPVNIGSGASCTVKELASLVADVVGFEGQIRWDGTRPDGAPEKRLHSDVMRLLGWSPQVTLRDGVERTYRWFLEHEMQEVSCASS
jgi:GDP-L-fucose synthase